MEQNLGVNQVQKTEGLLQVRRENGLWNYLKSDSTFLCETWYKEVWNFCNGFAKVQRKEDGKYNFIRLDGTLISKDWYDEAYDFCNGLATVRRQDYRYIFLKPDGTYISTEGLLQIRREDGLWNYLKSDGSFLCETWYKEVWSFCNGFARVQRKEGDKYNLIRPDGTPISKDWYDDANDFCNGFARIRKGYGWSFLKPDGTRIKFWCQEAYSFHNGCALVVRHNIDDKFNFINSDGKLLSNIGFYEADEFQENGLAQVRFQRHQTRYLIDTEGRIVADADWMNLWK